MYGRGSIEDARELQASFRQSNAPRRNNRGRGRGSGNGPQRGSFHGNGRQDHSIPARSAGGLHPISMYQGPPLPMPAPQSMSTRANRIASSERDHDSKRARNNPTEDLVNYFSNRQVSSQRFNSGMSTHRPLVDENDLMDFEQADSAPGPAMRQGNIPARPVPSSIVPTSSSILDTRGEEISQPVLDFTAGNEARTNRQDVAMGGTRRASLQGLNASRWNSQNSQSHSHYEGEPMSVDAPQSERRGPAPPSGRVVSSGISRGPGLADSRWAS
ncbi:hypothetical protein F5Y06DRAFT_241111 [Hypoxylon sp. FL0890]|nr:hypothetical protein F5Y06DRAFT_241111 [Hypoxylon sp. FL0890]